MNFKNLFTPVKIGKLELKNRFMMAPVGPLGLGDINGAFNQRGIDYYVERAKGGTGLICTGVCFADFTVEEHSCPGTPVPTLNPHQFIRTSREMTERIHAYGSKVLLQLSGGFGRVTVPEDQGADHPIAPSAIPHRWIDKTCRPVTVDEIHHIVTMFGKAAAIGKRAGYDGIMIHAVHEGYLIDQFAIAMFNHRTDEYGGPLENRLRLAREIREEIAKTCGWDYPVVMRLSTKSFIRDWRKGILPGEEDTVREMGRDEAEGLEVAKLLEQYGYDALDVDVGSYDSWFWSHPPMYQKDGLYLPYAAHVKKVVKVPVICAGKLSNPQLSSAAVEDGLIDIVSLGRPLLADADYVNKLRAGKADDIRPCISCQEGCMGRIQNYSLVNCAVNPQCAREREFAYNPILRPKKVVIVGGGVAGMEAARVLALRGHSPVIYEKAGCLGGVFVAASQPEFKHEDKLLLKWYEHTMEQLKVEIHLGTEMTPEKLGAMEYDALIVATGATPRVFDFGKEVDTGTKNGVCVHTATKVLNNHGAELRQSVTVIGGGTVGCELALWLIVHQKRDVTIVEANSDILKINAPLCSANKDMLADLLRFHKCGFRLNSIAERVTDKGIIVKNVKTGEETEIMTDDVIIAAGYTPDRSLYNAMQDVPELYAIGDCRECRNVHQAIWDAFEVANHI